MTTILRLQGLDVKAGTKDIRSFFKSLFIPDGGVYIVGGRLQEAFIAFTTEKEARLALQQTGNLLKGSVVTLQKSSMAELEQRLESLLIKRKNSPSMRKQQSPLAANPASSPCDDKTMNISSSAPISLELDTASQQPSDAHVLPSAHSGPALNQSLDTGTAVLLGIVTEFQGLQSLQNVLPNKNGDMIKCSDYLSEEKREESSLKSKPGYVKLYGLPASATKEDICHFFKGLIVKEAIVNIKLGLHHGCLVKFADVKDAEEALHFNLRPLGSFCVEVRGADESVWDSALVDCENAFKGEAKAQPEQQPSKKSRCGFPLQVQTQITNQSFKKSKLVPDPKNLSTEYIVMVKNLPKVITKTEIKELFGCPNIPHKNVLHLLDEMGNLTDTAFLTFNSTEDFNYAINLSGCHVGSRAIEVSSITREKMRDIMTHNNPRNRRTYQRDPRLQSRKLKHAK